MRWSLIPDADIFRHLCRRALLPWVFRALPFGRRDDAPEANLDPPEANLSDQPEDNLSDQPEVRGTSGEFLRGTGGFIRPTDIYCNSMPFIVVTKLKLKLK